MRPGLAGLLTREEPLMSNDSIVLLDAAGRRRSPATRPGYLVGRAPHNKGMQYPPDPPRPEEIILVMRQAGQDRHGLRIRALIAVLWRGGLRISEALALNETDVDPRRGSLMIRQGKGDKRREAGMDAFGFEQLAAWLAHRVSLPPGPLFCVIDGATGGRRYAPTATPKPALNPTRRGPPRDHWPSSHITRISNTPTSARPRHTSRASIRAKSSTPSAPADRPPSRPPPDSRSNHMTR
jgi:integrase